MMAKNPCIASIFMRNINPRVLEAQKEVVAKYNPTNIPHYQILTDMNPGYTLDKLVDMLESRGHDTIMYLDIDCVPLSMDSFEYSFQRAYEGVIIGDAQRSNHINNGQHVFAAPHNLAFAIHTYRELGSPSFSPNYRGDVAEELTFKAEESKIPLEILMPSRFDAPPIRMDWEPKDSPPYWDLADGMPKYGIGTTFVSQEGKELWWHMYQSFYPGQDERFLNKCKELLNNE